MIHLRLPVWQLSCPIASIPPGALPVGVVPKAALVVGLIPSASRARSFRLINMRRDVRFALVRNGLQFPSIAAWSAASWRPSQLL